MTWINHAHDASLAKPIIRKAPMLLVVLTALLLASVGMTGQTETVLHSFAGEHDGGYPAATLVRDLQGNLYGTTQGKYGTAVGDGTVFKIEPGGRETVLHNFTGIPDGAIPSGSLIRDAKGNLYGATFQGGQVGNCEDGYGCGTIFKVAASGEEDVLYSFPSENGGYPVAPLALDPGGNLYGTASDNYFGRLFELTSGGTMTDLYEFTGIDGTGYGGYGGLTIDTEDNLYGMSSLGGSSKCSFGCGTVFELSATSGFQLLYSFSGPDGYYPNDVLIEDGKGNFYGTTRFGGSNPACTGSWGCGEVFEVTSSGSLKILYSFAGGADGLYPYARLARDRQGNLYGTTYQGGIGTCQANLGCGVVFKLAPDGTETVLYSFTGASDGGSPVGGIVLDSQGNLYGTTYYGGAHGYGTVYKVTQ
jgi:uncharacterized repeat protein (TIGR03803 family)